ncbi:MAG TPA: hypothetical protein VGI35_01700 [Steroidobacteraceae bacterium]
MYRRILDNRARSGAHVRAAHRLNRATGLLAMSVLLDSGIEHYRGSFKNGFMFAPPAISALTLAVSAHGTADMRPLAHRARQAAFSVAALTGLAGTGFHIYNVLKRPGRLGWQNVFYGAPLGAPMAILLAGLLGAAAEEVRHTPRGRSARVFGLSAGRLLAAVSGAGILGTVAEAGLLHFRGAYHNPAMYAPVTVPPVSAALLIGAAASASPRRRRIARAWLRLTALLGFAGVGFHLFGIGRNMGGWRNWTQNVLNGPPLPAPPSFTGLALAGLAALHLLKERPHA